MRRLDGGDVLLKQPLNKVLYPVHFSGSLFLARYQLSIGVLHLQDLLPSQSNCGSFSLLSTAVLYTEIVR
jgi:hypothetical protein